MLADRARNERVRDHMLDELIESTEILSAQNRLLERALIAHHGVPSPGLIGDVCPICRDLGLDKAVAAVISSAAHDRVDLSHAARPGA